MNTVEDLKDQLLGYLTEAAMTDYTNTPGLYFLQRFQAELGAYNLPPGVVEVSLSINVAIGGLGPDYQPHKFFLDETARLYAAVVRSTYDSCQSLRLPMAATLSTIGNMSFTFE